VPHDVYSSETQYLTSPVGIVFVYEQVTYSLWNGTVNVLTTEGGRLLNNGRGPEEMKNRLKILADNSLVLTAAVQLGRKLLLFMGTQYMFYDDLTEDNVKRLTERMMFTSNLLKTREPPTIRCVYYDVKTSGFLFISSKSFFSVPLSLVDSEKGELYASVPELPLTNLYSCGSRIVPLLTKEAKWAALAISGTLAFILLVVCCVFHQISRRHGRGGLAGEITRLRPNRPSSTNMRKWNRSNTSNTGSTIASQIGSRTSSMASRSTLPSSAVASRKSSAVPSQA
jgi:hypothetical protein